VESIPVPVPRVSKPGFILPTRPHSMVVGQGGVWTLRYHSLFHVDPSRSEIRSRIELETGGQPFSVSLAGGSDKIWVAYDRGLIEANPATDAQREVMSLRTHVGRAPGSVDVVVGGGFVWVGTSDGRLVRYDPRTDEDRTRTDLDAIDAMAFGHGSVWTTDVVGGIVSRYDADTMRRVAEVDLAADDLVSGDHYVWTLFTRTGTLARIEPTTNEVVAVVQVGPDPFGLAAGAGAVWVGDEDGMIRRVDEVTRVVTEILLGAPVRTLAFDDKTDTIWVDVA
jgi:streptogramin lyase